MKILYGVLIFVPIAIIAEFMHAPALVIFACSALAIIPLAGVLGNATEELAGHTGPTLGGLLTSTLGNFAELVIAAFALRAGLVDLVKASITGSILGNLLLVLGAAQLAGGLKYQTQKINPKLVGLNTTLLNVAVLGLVLPALFHSLHPDPQRVATVNMSEGVSALLILGYLLSIVYTMKTHKRLFHEAATEDHAPHQSTWSLRRSIAVLIVAAVTVGVMSEILVGVTEEATKSLGLSEIFVGLIVIPIIGNAAENSSAVLMAMKNRMDLGVGIAVGSSVQVALVVAPLLVFLGLLFGQPMDLAFSMFEVVSVVLAVMVASSVIRDAESDWLEGAFLLIAYAAIAVAFFFF
ncbi:MAG TPA: calcium/proton exchanger [Gemmatimonadaceae bacterium]|nr:calcium/proton exchanger [Gemmatimonadaceae bacterium]